VRLAIVTLKTQSLSHTLRVLYVLPTSKALICVAVVIVVSRFGLSFGSRQSLAMPRYYRRCGYDGIGKRHFPLFFLPIVATMQKTPVIYGVSASKLFSKKCLHRSKKVRPMCFASAFRRLWNAGLRIICDRGKRSARSHASC